MTAANAARPFATAGSTPATLGYLDVDGYLFLTGRVEGDDQPGGEKISPYEVEDVLARHPAVAEVAVFARPHPSLGEDVGAALVLRPGQGLSDAEARAWVSARLSAFKVPRSILFLERLPRCPVGKVRRQELAELARQAEGRASPTPPANPLETFLARLWASELDVPVVGVEDDFVALGGDSLSSVRLLAATESLLGVRFSNDALAELKTVRGMARHIINQGYSPDVLPDLDVDAALLRAATQTARSTGDEAEDEDGDEDGSGAENKDARPHASGQASKSMGEALLNILTPQELLDALADPQVAGGLRPVGTGPGQDHETWLAQTREGVARAPNALRWQRQALDEFMHLYTAGGAVNPGEKTLLVGFTGRALRLMMPTYRFLMHLDADRFDLLLLRSADRGHYATGIPGRGGDIASLGAWLDSWATAQGYGRRISFGTSAGGLAALCVGLERQWDRAIAVGADLPSSHPEIEAALKQAALGATASQIPLVVLMYAALNARDQGAAREVGAILPFARHRRIKGTDVHNVLDVIFRRGMLRVRLHELLVGDPGGEVQASRPG
jgi:acyl carrier protein